MGRCSFVLFFMFIVFSCDSCVCPLDDPHALFVSKRDKLRRTEAAQPTPWGASPGHRCGRPTEQNNFGVSEKRYYQFECMLSGKVWISVSELFRAPLCRRSYPQVYGLYASVAIPSPPDHIRPFSVDDAPPCISMARPFIVVFLRCIIVRVFVTVIALCHGPDLCHGSRSIAAGSCSERSFLGY